MKISEIQKRLEAEHKALEQKFQFITELKALMDKHGQSSADLLAILGEDAGSDRAAPKSRKKAAAKPAKASRRKSGAQRPLRTFRHPETGAVAETRAPQVDKTIKAWAKELKVDWRSLEV